MSMDLNARYDLLTRAIRSESTQTTPEIGQRLAKLRTLVDHDLRELARNGSPDNFADLLQALQQELERFEVFCENPALAQKTVVGFGGAFSAGKSSLINAILKGRVLPVEVDPTTSVPTYIVHGTDERIHAINHFGRQIELKAEEFSSMTHDFAREHGYSVGHLLRSACVETPTLPWSGIALLDTPGYSKPDDEGDVLPADALVALNQLNAADALVWVVSAEGGVIAEQDIAFLGRLRPDMPKLVVLSRSDKRTPEDIASIIQLVQNTLANRGLPVAAVIPVSTRKKAEYPLDALLAAVQNWDTGQHSLTFARNFKKFFVEFSRHIDAELELVNKQLNRFNRILGLTDDTAVTTEIEALKVGVQLQLEKGQSQKEGLSGLKNQFFAQLKAMGDFVDIPMPEPDAIELMELARVDILALLRQRRPADQEEPDLTALLMPLISQAEMANAKFLLRAPVTANQSPLSNINSSDVPKSVHRVLLREPLEIKNVFSNELVNFNVKPVSDKTLISLLREPLPAKSAVELVLEKIHSTPPSIPLTDQLLRLAAKPIATFELLNTQKAQVHG